MVEDIVDVDADKDADIRHLTQLPTELEITVGTEVPHNGKESVKVDHAGGNSLKFFKESVIVGIVEELGAHSDSASS